MSDDYRIALGARFKLVRVQSQKRGEPSQGDFAKSLDAMADKVLGSAKRRAYVQSLVNRLELGKQDATVQDIAVYAAMDVRKRGKLWLGWGELSDTVRRESEAELAHRIGAAPMGMQPSGDVEEGQVQPEAPKRRRRG